MVTTLLVDDVVDRKYQSGVLNLDQGVILLAAIGDRTTRVRKGLLEMLVDTEQTFPPVSSQPKAPGAPFPFEQPVLSVLGRRIVITVLPVGGAEPPVCAVNAHKEKVRGSVDTPPVIGGHPAVLAAPNSLLSLPGPITGANKKSTLELVVTLTEVGFPLGLRATLTGWTPGAFESARLLAVGVEAATVQGWRPLAQSWATVNAAASAAFCSCARRR
jgi:hypothetical protein